MDQHLEHAHLVDAEGDLEQQLQEGEVLLKSSHPESKAEHFKKSAKESGPVAVNGDANHGQRQRQRGRRFGSDSMVRSNSVVLDELKSVREHQLTAEVVKVLNDEPRGDRRTQCRFPQFLGLVFLLFYPITIGVWHLFFEPWLCFLDSKWRHKKASMLAWVIMAGCVAYAIDILWKLCGFHMSCVLTTDFHFWLAIARLSGKLISVFTFLALFVVLKPVVDLIEGQPISRGRLNWRRYHYYFVVAAFTAAVVHGFAHGMRQDNVKNTSHALPSEFERFENVTGIILYLCYMLTGLPIWTLQVLDTCPKSSKLCSFTSRESKTRWNLKKAFRRSHIPFYLVITFVYVIHASDVWPFIYLLVWYVVNSWSVVKVQDLEYRFVVDGLKDPQPETSQPKYILELRVTARDVMPVDFGFYCVLSRGSCFASYTMIPLNRNQFMFRIKNCVLTESLRPLLNSSDQGDENYWFKTADPFVMTVHGPYHSSDYSIANAKKLAVFVNGTGNAVSDAIIRFVDEKPRYFRKVIVFNMGGGDSLNYGIATSMIKGCALPVSDAVTELKSTEEMLQTKLPEAMNSDIQLTIFNFKNMNVNICEHLMKCIQQKHFVDGVEQEGYHIMICSEIWRQYLDIIRARDVKKLEQRRIDAQKAQNSGKQAEPPFVLRKIRDDILHVETFEF
eukprot:g25624.t1